MATDLAPLFTPLKLGGGGVVELKNRIVMSALTRDRSVPTNVPNKTNLEYYEQRAAGGTGLIVCEGTLISQQGTEWQHAPGIWNEEHVVAWRKITDAVHAHGGKIFCQLWHLGRVSHPDAPEQKASGTPVYAPSAIAARGGKFRFLPGAPGYQLPTEIPESYVKVIIEQYRKAAINAKEAGFDGVELHGANGYLVQQFFDSSSNQRPAPYGGSPEARSKFGLEILKVLLEVWGPGKVAVKLNPCGGYNDMGMPLDETLKTYGHFISEADKLGLAYVCLVRYAAKLDPVIDGAKRATEHDVVASYGPLLKNTPLILNADVSPPEAATLVSSTDSSKKISGGVFGWLFISNPDLVKRLEQGVALNYDVNVKHLYGDQAHGGEDVEKWVESQREGYSDYPFATQVKL